MRFDYKKIALILLSCIILSCSMPLHAFALNPDVSEGFINKYFSGIATFPAFQLSKLLALYGVHVDYDDIGLMEYTYLINSMDSYTFTNTLGQTTKLSDAISAISAVGGGSFMYLLRNVYRPNDDAFGQCFQEWISDHFGDSVGDTGVIGHKNELHVFPANVPLDFSGYAITNNIRTDFDLKFCYKDTDFILFTVDTDQNYAPYPFNEVLPNKKWTILAAPATLSYLDTITSESKLRSVMISNIVTDPAANSQYAIDFTPFPYKVNNHTRYIYHLRQLYQNQTYLFYPYDFPIYKAPSGMTEKQFLDMYYSGQIDTVTGVVYDTPTLNDLPDPTTDSGYDFYQKYLTLGDEAYYYLSSSITNNYVDSIPELVQYTNEYVTYNYDININLPNISDLVDFNLDFGSTTSDYIVHEHGIFTNANNKISEFESTMPDIELLPGLLSGISFCSNFITDFFYASGGSTGGYGIIFGLSVTFLLLSLIIGVSSFIGKGGK